MTPLSWYRALAIVAIVVAAQSNVFAQSNRLVVIELHSRTASEVIPVLRPMLAPGATISGLRDKIVVRTTPENLAELRMMLEVIDAPPRRLLISVSENRGISDDSQEIDVSGSIGNDSIRVVLPDDPNSAVSVRSARDPETVDSIKIRARSSQSDTTKRIVQSVQVVEGSTAFIGTGESIPIRASGTTGSANAGETIGFQQSVAGFYAVPRIQGDRVTIQLSTAADTVRDRQSGTVHIERITTVLSGKLGEWIEVGGIGESGNAQQSEIAARRSSDSQRRKRVYVKVEELN